MLASARRLVTVDALVVGSGMVGASTAFSLARAGADSVMVLEMEDAHGVHSTGRSAALYSETYGSPLTRALTTASKLALHGDAEAGAPPADDPFLRPRGTVWVARQDQLDTMDAMLDAIVAEGLVTSLKRLDEAELRAIMPAIRPGYAAAGVYEPDAMDMDVNGLHMAFIRGGKAASVDFRTGAGLLAAAWDAHAGLWEISDTTGSVHHARMLVNAAGAWGDVVAERSGIAPLGLVPKRRTIMTWPAPAAADYPADAPPAAWPMVFDVDEEFYFKPDAGQMLASPADATPVEPHDAYADDMDVAVCADRIMTATDLSIETLTASWAGLRTFAPDSDFVLGPDGINPSFVWAVGMGGYGIQTAPATGAVVAATATGSALPSWIVNVGITSADPFSPSRFS
ncbi:FAD dependent oxidoreductase [Thecamonas trahens ATCC 50062]|uniref:FAD-dependent oxidoreductase domain-containing protein 1 n=1 Tax=Thecamonas trahens ATCC 50062 TaxID=461836 RepID=A0A0L0D4U3_THETB|nr:FAD dependent oxidoreductase [Thecamonas trahens ATCC 50062]KNC47349.1 FAD dependent oxidoreductase [Thecamonas trahens ATCC 50062]|eukprot:XP_013759687.1 FAD dependent oxidoreductase [Thecamonas trahens ATCC 50062]